MTERANRSYTVEFKQETVALVSEQGYSVLKLISIPYGFMIIKRIEINNRLIDENFVSTEEC